MFFTKILIFKRGDAMDKVLVKRSDPIYIEIENFKDYELTNNIAYEMLYRNKFSRDLEAAIEGLESRLMNILRGIEDITGYKIFSCEEFKAYKVRNFFEVVADNMEKLNDLRQLVETNKQLKTLVYRFDKSKKQLESLEYLAVKLCIPLYLSRSDPHRQFKVPGMKDSGQYLYANVDKFIQIKTSIDNYKIGWNYFPTFEDSINGVKESAPLVSFMSEPISKIFPMGWERDKLISPYMTRAMVEINFSYPENEIIAYIKEIKKHIGKDSTLLNFTDDDYDNSLAKSMHDIYDKKGYRVVHTPNSKKVRFAHLFFVYDAYEVGMSQRNIKQQIDDYEYDILQKPTKRSNGGIDEETISKLYQVSKDYIDNFKYVELVSNCILPTQVLDEIEATKPIIAKIISRINTNKMLPK